MWIRFYYKIEGIATTLKLKNSNEDEQTIIQRQLKIIDMVTFVLVILVIGYTIGIVADYKTYYPKDNMSYEEIVQYQWTIFLSIGLFFAFVGILFFAVSHMTIR